MPEPSSLLDARFGLWDKTGDDAGIKYAGNARQKRGARQCDGADDSRYDREHENLRDADRHASAFLMADEVLPMKGMP